MSGRKTHPLDVILEGKAEQVRLNIEDRLRELDRRSEVSPLGEVALPDSKVIRIGHQLGRYPKLVICSPPRGATTPGLLEEVRDGIDRAKFVGLRATGFGATVRVDVAVV